MKVSQIKMIKVFPKSFVIHLALLSTIVVQFSFYQVQSTTCNEDEQEALLKFKGSFADPSHRLASWRGTNCCNWIGVGCNQTTGHVIKIDLRNNQVLPSTAILINSIHSESALLQLKYLNYLDLSWNFFNYSQIPNILGSISELTYLNLSHASLYGQVPSHLGNLTKLVVLDLSYNDCYIRRRKMFNDEDEWVSRLSSLQVLALSGMNLMESTNLMQLVSSLPLLLSLRLSSCSLQNDHLSYGSLNSSFLIRIQLLDLSLNNFNGSVHESFQNMTSLKFLDLSKNSFEGSIPFWFRNLGGLVVLSLEQNRFTSIEAGFSSIVGKNCHLRVFDLSFNFDLGGDVFGSYENESMSCDRYDLEVLDLTYVSVKNKIPDWLGKFDNLRSLNLRNSYIYGSIPASLGNLSNIEDLDFSGNDLSGAIPSSFGRLLNLRKLNLAANRLEEVGVECLSQLENLEVLDISKNSLKGVISEVHFANLSQLHTLQIGYNDFLSLNMKTDWIPPFQLNFLEAVSCMGFGSKFPQWLQTQKELVVLQLFNMSISGALPTWLRGPNLTTLDLSHNQIKGPIPMGIGNQMPNLKGLFLNNNLISDSLPPSICELKNLEVLDLSGNNLSGKVHGCFLTSNMLVMDLSSNKFSGIFPYSHGNLSNIQQLYLRNNNFEGSMPIILKNSKFLKFLDLEGNRFFGNIPTWVGDNLGDLRFLILRGNMFNGSIPLSLCLATHLQVLDLAHNHLGGDIPSHLSNFRVMTGRISHLEGIDSCTGFDIFCNYIKKNVRQYLKSMELDYSLSQLSLMVNIDLSKNNLVGLIPSEITTLKELIGLNLSHNNLRGTIPTKMGEMESLQSLDLSFNQFSGPIPKSMSKLSYLGVLKLSHNNLSGDIPREGHLSTFNEASSFDGNPYLCGVPLLVKCTIKESFEPPSEIENVDQEEDKWEKLILYIMIMLGYMFGFWVVVGVLIWKRRWRYAYFKFVDETKYKIHETMSSTIARLKGNRIH